MLIRASILARAESRTSSLSMMGAHGLGFFLRWRFHTPMFAVGDSLSLEIQTSPRKTRSWYRRRRRLRGHPQGNSGLFCAGVVGEDREKARKVDRPKICEPFLHIFRTSSSVGISPQRTCQISHLLPGAAPDPAIEVRRIGGGTGQGA
jgi:hypothetical protein